MKIKVNGKEEILEKGKTLSDIVEEKGVDPERVVVEYDLQIINKDEWSKTVVSDGGTVEIVSFMGGG
jgi:sulfur carrier protein